MKLTSLLSLFYAFILQTKIFCQTEYSPSFSINKMVEKMNLEQINEFKNFENDSTAFAIDFNYTANISSSSANEEHNGRTLYTILDFGSIYGGFSLHFDGIDTIRLDIVMDDNDTRYKAELRDRIILTGESFSNKDTNTAYIGIQKNSDLTTTFYLQYGDTVKSSVDLKGWDHYDNFGLIDRQSRHSSLGYLRYNAPGFSSIEDKKISVNGQDITYYDRINFADLDNSLILLSFYDQDQIKNVLAENGYNSNDEKLVYNFMEVMFNKGENYTALELVAIPESRFYCTFLGLFCLIIVYYNQFFKNYTSVKFILRTLF